MNADTEWSQWWAASGLDLLVLAPRPVGPPGGMIKFTAKGNVLDVMASSASLWAVLMAPHHFDEAAGIHGATPETPGLFRELIHDMTVQTARHIGLPAPPRALPG